MQIKVPRPTFKTVTPNGQPTTTSLIQVSVCISGLILEINCPGMRMSRAISATECAKRILGFDSKQRVNKFQLYDEMIALKETIEAMKTNALTAVNPQLN